VLEAAGWAALAASTLVIGAWLGTVQSPSARRAGLVMGFGAGALIASVAFELTEEAFAAAGAGPLVAGLGIGALTFFVGDRKVDRMGGSGRKSGSATWEGNANALLLGAALDGVPESLIIGLSLIGGGSVEVAFLVSVAVSNVPEGFASATQQHAAGISTWTILRRWLMIVALSAVCGAIGFALFDELDPRWVAFTQAFAAGALLTMVMDTMAPEAFRDAGPVTGLVAVAGFWLAFWLGTR
jgi:ZIP family zinc transporter